MKKFDYKARCPICESVDIVDTDAPDAEVTTTGESYSCLDCEADFTGEEMRHEINRKNAAREVAKR